MVVIVLLLLGGVGLLHADVASAQQKRVEGVVTEVGDPTNLLADVAVSLRDAHGQKDPLSTSTGVDGTYSFSPDPGFYVVTVSKDGFFDNETAVFRFDGTATLTKDIEMEAMPAPVSTLTVHVEEPDTDPVVNASVEVFDPGHDQIVDTGSTNASGNATFSVWDATFEVRVSKPGFNKSVASVVVSGDTVHSVTLFPGIRLVGIAKDPEGSFVTQGLTAFLYNLDVGTPDAKRLLPATVVGSSYTFFAYPGEFVLIVDADGRAANITTIDVPLGGRIDRVLTDSPDERVDTAIRYDGGDWNRLALWRNLTLNEDSSVAALPFAQVRNLRLQIDLALGDGDGNLTAGERDAFLDYLQAAGPKQVDTADLFTTNDRFYRSDLTNGTTEYQVWAVDFPLDAGPAVIATRANYTRVGTDIPVDLSTYFVNVTGDHDPVNAVRVNTTYTVHAVPTYERTAAEVTGSVAVSGYLAIEVDPLLDPNPFRVEMELAKSESGTARVAVVSPPDRFTELNASQENYTAVVPTNESMTFTAEESSDPNSPDGRVNPDSNFTWSFVNASASNLTYGIRPNVTFSVFGMYAGNLTIVEVGGNTTYRNFTLHVDGIRPVAVLENNVTGLGTDAHNTTIEVSEGHEVRFFGGNSSDQAYPGREGVIRAWEWDFDGDGDVDRTGQSVVWDFDEPGTFVVNLTVVDQAGHESVNATMTVEVADVTPPAVEFRVLDESFEEPESLVEKVSYVFDGTATTDNADSQANLTFEWDFGDDETAAGANVTHAFDEFGTYTVVLNVTDQAGNQGNASQTFLVEVDPEDRPDLEVEGGLRVEPRNPEESTFFGTRLVTLRFNVTNKEGRAPAESVSVQFFAFRFGESPGQPIDIEPRFYVPGTDTERSDSALQPGEKLEIRFTWTTGPEGNWTLRANVSAPNEPTLFIGPRNTAETQIDVRQAAWKLPLLIGSIVAVIVGIPVALYFRRRIVGRVRERLTRR